MLVQSNRSVSEEFTSPAGPGLMHVLVERSARRNGRAEALVTESIRWTYAELNAKANQLARVLVRMGVRRESIVALCCERSAEAIALIIAVAKSGGTFVPLDPSHPAERIAWMIDDLQPQLIVADGPIGERLATESRCKPWSLAALFAAACTEDARNVNGDVQPDDLAYVVYTSGSSGRPKGVMIEHASICNTLRSAVNDYGLRHDDRVLFLVPFSFDPAIFQTIGVLASGACIVVAPPGAERDPRRVAELIEHHRVTILPSVPVVIAAILDSVAELHPSLRAVISGGSTLLPALRDRLHNRKLTVFNCYGPAEAAIQATVHRCSPDDPVGFVPLGPAITGTRVHVLNDRLEAVTSGSAGEIYLAGRGLARGYLRRPDLTAERFTFLPAASGINERVYRTGDIARVCADGSFEYIGRRDEQVKIRGVRIELAEVEAVLERHPDVAAAVVLYDAEPNDRLRAYVVGRRPSLAAIDGLATFARDHLVPQAVPGAFVYLESMPMLSSGKIDKRRLAAMPCPERERSMTAVKPADPLDAALIEIWERVLGRSGIGLDDDFFAAGGDSLAAVRIVLAIEEWTQRPLSLEEFFREPTIAAIGRSLRTGGRATLERAISLSPSGPEAPLFFLHGDAAGLGFYCRRFAAVLGRNRAVFAMPPHGTGGGAVPATVEKMAADHLADIRKRQPEGPYLIGGYCIGAIVAYEVVRQLESAGQSVTRLVLVEGQGPRLHSGFFEDRLARTARRYGIPGGPVRWWSARALKALRWLKSRIVSQAIIEPHSDPLIAAIDVAQGRAVDNYVWEPLAAPATMICAYDEQATPEAVLRNWSGLFPAVDVRIVPGNHVTMLGRHASELIAAMDAALAQSSAERSIR